ncbi:YihY family inner membrane protein [Alloalcanivorax mobilis]|uniref:YihY family inner membrane protein n=1 Tax=Alloalcanivorax mobilis TaxID=2019569 RepID=UPI000C7898FD
MRVSDEHEDNQEPVIPFRARAASVWAFLRLLGRQFVDDGCQSSAAALTYTTLFAIVPIMTVMFAVIAAIPELSDRGMVIQHWAFEYLVPTAGNQVLEHLSEFSRQATKLTGVGVVFLVVTSVLMLRTVEQTLNRIWKVREPRKGLTSMLMYWALLSLGPMLLGVGLGISSYLTSLSLVNDTVAYLGGVRFWLSLLPFLLTLTMLTLLYTVVPNTSVPFRQGLLGAAVAALLFELAKTGFAQFIKHAPSYQVVYGAFAAVPVFLLWVYISWILVLLGAELVRALVVFEEHRRRVPRLQAMMRLLHVFWTRQRQGKVLNGHQVRRVLRESGVTHWDEFRNLLQDSKLIRRTDDGGYVLVRDLRGITLGQLVAMMPWPVEQQLSVHGAGKHSWEHELKSRCDLARQGLHRPLNLDLESLFQEQTVPIPESPPEHGEDGTAQPVAAKPDESQEESREENREESRDAPPANNPAKQGQANPRPAANRPDQKEESR